MDEDAERELGCELAKATMVVDLGYFVVNKPRIEWWYWYWVHCGYGMSFPSMNGEYYQQLVGRENSLG